MKKKKSVFRKIKRNVEKEHNSLNKCMRCEKQFGSRTALKTHSKAHLQAMQELKMLEEGFKPDETKLGSDFKGKNKIIVA